MRKLLYTIVLLAISMALTVQCEASRKSRAEAYSDGTCRQKIDVKNLKGQALKDAWKSCRESPDSYN
jgi:hypothetical protein